MWAGLQLRPRQSMSGAPEACGFLVLSPGLPPPTLQARLSEPVHTCENQPPRLLVPPLGSARGLFAQMCLVTGAGCRGSQPSV